MCATSLTPPVLVMPSSRTRGRSLSVWSELEKLVKFLEDGVLCRVLAGELVEVKTQNYLWMCNQAHDDHLVAVGWSTDVWDGISTFLLNRLSAFSQCQVIRYDRLPIHQGWKRTKRLGDMMARPAKKARAPRKEKQTESVKDSGSISGGARAASGSKATTTKKKMARKNGRKGV